MTSRPCELERGGGLGREWFIVGSVNGIELYLLAQKLMAIATESLPEDAALRRVTPVAGLVLDDIMRNAETSAAAIAGRTGLEPDQVSAIVAELAADGLVETGSGRIVISRARAFRINDLPGIEEALSAALPDAGAVAAGIVAAALDSLARYLEPGRLLRGISDFDAAYQGTPPWDIGHPQPAFAELARAGAFSGRVLDVGCGTGEHAMLAAGLGLASMGIDSSPTAIGIARRKAAERGLGVRFAVHSALDLGALGEQFDTVLDSALFHVFGDEERRRYVDSLRAVVPPGGRYFMLCFSDRQPPGFGPRRVSQAEIEAAFADGWRIDAIEPVTLEVTDPAGVLAWRAALTRV
jgi:SAM-dependent methyltransferase